MNIKLKIELKEYKKNNKLELHYQNKELELKFLMNYVNRDFKEQTHKKGLEKIINIQEIKEKNLKDHREEAYGLMFYLLKNYSQINNTTILIDLKKIKNNESIEDKLNELGYVLSTINDSKNHKIYEFKPQ